MIMAEEDNIFESEGLDLAREREQYVIDTLSKIIPDAASWATEELIFPLLTPTMLFSYAMDLVNEKTPTSRTINNFVDALGKEQYAAGTGPIEAGVYDATSLLTGTLGGGIVYEAALDKIKASQPKVYEKLTRAFPYWVDHVHNNAPGIIKNAKGVTVGDKAINLAKGFGRQIKHMMPYNIPNPTRFRIGANLAKIGVAGTGAGFISNLLSSKPTGGEGELSDQPFTRLTNYIADSFTNNSGFKIEPNELVVDMENYRVSLGPEAAARFEDQFPGVNKPVVDKYQTIEIMDRIGALPINVYEEPEKIIQGMQDEAEERNKEKERIENLPQDLKNREVLKDLAEFFVNTKPVKDAKSVKNYVAGIPSDIAESRVGQSIASAYRYAKGIKEEPYDMITMTPEYIAEDAKDKAENEQYMAERMNQTLQPAPFIDKMAMGGEPGLDTNIFDILQANDLDQEFKSNDVFEEARKKGYEETEVAMGGSLFGKAPIWAVGDVPKPKIGTQDLTKGEKTLLDNLSKKILDDTDESIIDSPEINESMFYSGLEARLMDPNTPKTFNSVEDFYKFLQNKQISKKEIEDNILENYLAIATKNKTPLVKEDMLNIVRQAPMRKVESIIYGNANYGGEKNAIYTSYKESGEIPGSYRESVLYVDPKHIPQDPDSLPRSSHDFTERYVIGWSRKTDRNATLPVEKTKQGIAATVDPAMIRTLKRNQQKLKNQLAGLEASAYEKMRRELGGDLTPTDEMNARMIRETIDSRMAFLEEIDMPLANQIRQFRSKIQDDSVRLGEMEAATKGKKVVVTFADEIQSDILQQAKELENELRQQLGSILDLPVERRAGALAQERTRYSGSARNVEPEVLDFYSKNETIFRPMFNTAEEMQSFVDEFQKNKVAIDVVAKGGPAPSDEAIKAMNIAIAKEKKMLEDLNIGLSEGAMKQLFPNVPFKNREEWGDILVKRDLAEAAQRLFMDKVDGAAEWYAVSPADLIKNRYASAGLNKGGTNTPLAERQAAKERGVKLKGIGVEEFYGGPNSVDTKGKHYTSSLEKSLKRAAKENNSEFKIIEVDGVGKVFAIKLTPEMLLPHKTHRKDGGMVYTPEIIDIFEAA
jgi:hypothetical protein